MTSSSGLVTKTSNATSKALSRGTVDLLGAFKTLERRTGTYFQTTPMDAARRADLIEDLITWSTTRSPEGFDWEVLDEIDPPAPDDFEP